ARRWPGRRVLDPCEATGNLRPDRAVNAACAAALTTPAADVDTALLRDRRWPGRIDRRAGVAGRGHRFRLVRTRGRGRRNLESGSVRRTNVRVGALHLVAVDVRVRRPPDAADVSGLPVVAAGQRLHPRLRGCREPDATRYVRDRGHP